MVSPRSDDFVLQQGGDVFVAVTGGPEHFGVVLALWNIGFIVKFGVISAGKSIFAAD